MEPSDPSSPPPPDDDPPARTWSEPTWTAAPLPPVVPEIPPPVATPRPPEPEPEPEPTVVAPEPTVVVPVVPPEPTVVAPVVPVEATAMVEAALPVTDPAPVAPVAPDGPGGPAGPRRTWLLSAVVVAVVLVVVLAIAVGGGTGDDGTTATGGGTTTTALGAAPGPLPGATPGTGSPSSTSAADSPNDPNAPAVDPGESPNAPVSIDASAPDGTRAHPFAIGTPGTVGGWRITVTNASGAGEKVTADVTLEWVGRDGATTGNPAELVLRVNDAAGTDHTLGGASCPADASTDLAKLPALDPGGHTTASLCWTVPGVDRRTAALVAEDDAVADSTFLAVA